MEHFTNINGNFFKTLHLRCLISFWIRSVTSEWFFLCQQTCVQEEVTSLSYNISRSFAKIMLWLRDIAKMDKGSQLHAWKSSYRDKHLKYINNLKIFYQWSHVMVGRIHLINQLGHVTIKMHLFQLYYYFLTIAFLRYYLFIYLFVYLFICLFIHLFIYLSIYLFIYLFILTLLYVGKNIR